MRKLEYLRKLAKKVKEEKEIYSLDVTPLKAKNTVGDPVAIPAWNEEGKLIGIAVEHAYEWEDTLWTYQDIYIVPFPNVAA